MSGKIIAVLTSALLLSACAAAQAQNAPRAEVAGIPVNYDESRVGNYTLPDPLTLNNGAKVRDAKTWVQKRRPEIVRLFEENQFGRSPARPDGMSFDVFDKGAPALDGKALRRQVTVYFSGDKAGPKMDLLIYLPAGARKPVPLLLNLSFTANSTAVDDPGVKPGEIWGREKKRVPAPKGSNFGKLNVAPFLAQGFGVATVYYGDIDPDFQGGLPYGVRSLYLKPGQQDPEPDEWGAIGAWAWGLSRAMDYLETDKDVDAKRVAILGVSRLGKTVLWAGAHDERFAMVIASCSGEGGAALSRRNYGETIKHLTEPTRYPYQFCANYGKYGDHVDQFPVDAHMLIALIAPRPVLLQTGDKDLWSDPKGEFLAAVAAEPVFRLLGKQALGTERMPPAGQPILHTLGYSMHAGGHGTIPSDWNLFLEFMRMHLLTEK
ncbi:MAG: acetylxylan esterase [Chloracidobacterium sp.]|nr:acetylxylan esterase [Chloracidobacterium sp.]